MTGESEELKKESLSHCLIRKEEKLEEAKAVDPDLKNLEVSPHDLPSPLLLSGTQISTGEGWMLVIVVGKDSCVGKIMDKLVQPIQATPLQ